MSQKIYHDGDTLDQAFDIWCQSGRSSEQLKKLAEKLVIEQSDLLQRWGLPLLKPVPETNQDQGFDLWAADRAQEVL